MSSTQTVNLKKIVRELESGGRPKGGIVDGQGVIFSLGGEHLNNNGGFNLVNERRISVEFFHEMKRGKVQPQDILIVKDGATTGKVSFIPENFSELPCAINEHVFRLSVKQDLAYPKYVFYYLYGARGNGEIMQDFRGATIGGISQDFVNYVQIPLPPIPKQERIATILDKADHVRRLRRYVLELGDSYLQSVFSEMFGDPATNPKGWKSGKIGDVVTFSQYGTSRKSNYDKQGYPVLGMGSITYSGEIDLSNISYVNLTEEEFQELRLDHGDVIFNRTNSTELVGKTAYWNLDMDAVIASYLVRLKLREDLLPQYFVALLNSSYFKSLFQLRCRKAVGQSNISPTYLKEFSLLVPPLSLQQNYVEIVNRRKYLRILQREALRQSELLFQSLIVRAFEGGL